MKNLKLLIIPLVIFISCDDDDTHKEPHEMLVGTWNVASVTQFSNSDCTGGDGIDLNISGTITYTESSATIDVSLTQSLEDYCLERGGQMDGENCIKEDGQVMTPDDFANDCTADGEDVGQMVDGNCVFSFQESFDYMLSSYIAEGSGERGYCEIYYDDGSGHDADGGTEYNCGTANIDENRTTLIFPPSEDDEGGCQYIELTR
tara:strand:+ start:111 stop:722 length:612 start_codon:yes stop_codon:yes gene_type:complete